MAGTSKRTRSSKNQNDPPQRQPSKRQKKVPKNAEQFVESRQNERSRQEKSKKTRRRNKEVRRRLQESDINVPEAARGSPAASMHLPPTQALPPSTAARPHTVSQSGHSLSSPPLHIPSVLPNPFFSDPLTGAHTSQGHLTGQRTTGDVDHNGRSAAVAGQLSDASNRGTNLAALFANQGRNDEGLENNDHDEHGVGESDSDGRDSDGENSSDDSHSGDSDDDDQPRRNVARRNGALLGDKDSSSSSNEDRSDSESDSELNEPEETGEREKSTGSKNRPRLYDLDGKEKVVGAYALEYFKALVCIHGGIISAALEADLVEQAWAHACKVNKYKKNLSDHMRRVILSGTSSVRGAVKDKVRASSAMVELGFRVTTADNTENVQYNQNLYAQLWAENQRNFTFVNRTADDQNNVTQRSHPYQHRFVAAVIQEQFFKKRSAIGRKESELFDPISLEFIAFIYTLVRHCIDDWEDGFKASSPPRGFSADAYKNEYEGILKDLKMLQGDQFAEPVMTQLRERMIRNIRESSGMRGNGAQAAVVAVTAADAANMANDGLLDG